MVFKFVFPKKFLIDVFFVHFIKKYFVVIKYLLKEIVFYFLKIIIILISLFEYY